MKVVLFCGGLGTRLREYSETIPKPLVPVGNRPIMWNLMKYYAHFGHKEFILCLGHGGEAIKQYFLDYNECLSNDFSMINGGRTISLFNQDIADWKITFIDTGRRSNIGQRLLAVRDQLAGEELFMANYADGLTDLHLPSYLDFVATQDKVASFLSVRPSQSFHIVRQQGNGLVQDIAPIDGGDIWINGGFFVFKQAIFDYMEAGEELVMEPFQRLIALRQLATYQNPGFWACMDTFKEKKLFDDLYDQGERPWAVWKNAGRSPAKPALGEFEDAECSSLVSAQPMIHPSAFYVSVPTATT